MFLQKHTVFSPYIQNNVFQVVRQVYSIHSIQYNTIYSIHSIQYNTIYSIHSQIKQNISSVSVLQITVVSTISLV